jgi:uncharacterized repeat protein (TIGR02543 family)
MFAFNRKQGESMSSTTKLRIRKKLSQLLAGIVIAPLFTLVPVFVGPSVLPSAFANTASCTTGSYSLTISNGEITATTNNSCTGTLDLSGFSITDIKANFAFNDNANMTGIIFPSTLTKVSGFAAFNKHRFKRIDFPCSLQSITGGQAFQGVGNHLKTVQMCANGGTPSSTFSMGYYAFGENTGLRKFSFGSTLATTVTVTTWDDSANPTWGNGATGIWFQYCGNNTTMSNGLVPPRIPTGSTKSCSAPTGWVEEPGPPTGVSGTVANTSSVVSWTAPGSNGGSTITGYRVTSSPGGFTCNTATTSCTVSGLTNGTAYRFRVFATNSAGDSPDSSPSSSVTPSVPPTVPGAPTGVSGTVANASSVVSWTAPGSNGGSAITSYTVTSTPGGLTCNTATTSCTVNGLTNGTAYTFTVRATNAVGNSDASAASASVTPRTVPGTPTGVSGTAANASSNVSWSAPGSTGGSAITGYTVTSSPSVAAPASCTNTANLSCTFTGLTNGTAYTFSVIAINAAGNSTAGTSSSVTPRTVPGAPTGVSGTIDYVSSVVSWSAPGSNGGSAITGYTVTSSPGGLTCTTTSTSCRVNGLTDGLTYTFTVVATNAAGDSLASNASAGVTPLAPFYVYCKNSNGVDQTITVSAVVSANSLSSCFGIVTLGAGITRLSGSTFLTAAQEVKILSNPTFPADFNTGVTGIVFPEGFTTLDTYSLAGLGAVSSLAFPNSLAPIPTAVFLRSNIKTLDFSAFLGNYGSFTISSSAFSFADRPQWWRDCSAGGGVPTSGYLFDYLALRGGTAYCAPTTVATLSSLTPSSGILQTQFVSSTLAYNLSVANSVTSINFSTTLTDSRASVYVNKMPQTNGSNNTFTGGVPNSISLGAGTTEISIVVIAQDGTTQVNYTVSVTRLAFEVPGAPTGVSGTVANASSVVSWTAPGSNGGSAITGYTVTSSPGGFTCTTTTTSCTVNGLTNGTSYTFRVIATNAAGNSVPSTASASVTPRSSDATLSASSIKGQSTTLGTPNAVLTSVTAGTITLTTAQATGVDTTTFTKTDAGATISRIVKYASGASTTNFETDTAFSDGATTTVANGDFFIVKVTAGDGTVRYYRVNVIVNSNISTLSGLSVKGQISTLGTPNATLGSETAGTITLTTAQATGAAATTFIKSDAGSSTKIVKYLSGTTADTTNFGAATDFTSGTTTTFSNGDYLIVRVDAADGSTVNYYRINVTVNSDVATLSGATIKGQTPTLGTAGSALGSLAAGAITLTTAQATGTDTTTFTKTDAGATITKIVKLASSAVENLTNFNAAAAFTDGAADAVSNGDYFLIQVTSADGTVRFYRVNVTVNSNISTLSGISIKGQTSTLGTPNATLGSETAGAITLTTAQATGIVATTFTKTDAGSTTKIVKYLSGATADIANFDAATDLTSGTTTTVSNGDFFIIKVTAQDGSSVNYYRVNVTVNSDVATLSGATIKGQTPTLGNPNAVLASATAGAITLTTAQATGVDTTTFTKTDAGATVTKIVKYATGASTNNFETDAAFSDGATTTVSNGDFFIIKVTAADATVRFYRVNITVNSNVATLSAASIKGLTPTLGTPNATLGSETAGAITLTTGQATGAAATTFTKTDAGATVSRIVKYAAAASTANFETDAAFSDGATTTVSNNDFFIIKVTAADATINYYRMNITVNSDVATLSGASIKGQASTLGTPNAVLASVVAGTIALTTAQATGAAATTFTKTDAGATISRIVKYANGASTANFETDAAFTNSATTAVSNNDFFIVKVIAADASVGFYRFNVTVNSNVATLSSATVKGLSATLGTVGTALGSLSAGTITVTLSEASGSSLTTFTKTDAGATITKIAKLATGTVENLTNFNAAAAFTNGAADAVSNGDFFIIQVTAADATINYYRVNIVFATNPTVPLNLIATAQAGGANLTWNAPTGDGGSALIEYKIQASTDAVTWNDVATTNVSTRQFSVTTLNNGTAYRYRVRAVNSSGNESYNWATSGPVTSFYRVLCSTSGSFYVSSTASPVQIPSYAGKDCKGEVTIPVGIKMINRNAFTASTDGYNRFVTAVTLPVSGLQTIDQLAFRRLGLTSITIPATVEVVGNYSFDDNFITTAVVLGTTDGFPAAGNNYYATNLGQAAFRNNGKNSDTTNNSGLALTLGNGKIDISELFGQDTVFASVDWGTGLKSIGRRAFYNVAAGSWAPLFPATITSFGIDAFFGTGIKTIRFGTATTQPTGFTIASTAFDPSITSVQYCGTTGTVLSNYINSRFTSKTIWCSEEVPNAPINLTAAAGASGQVVLNWAKGATRATVEAPTDSFEVRYSSDGGSTWSAVVQAAGSATSLIVPNLSNGTSYTFQIRAKNLFGASVYSVSALGTPLGTQVNPTFGPSTSTAVGFTVNVINYDPTYTYSVPQVTAGSGTVTVGVAAGNILPITVSGMSPGSVATISIDNQKSNFSSGNGVASGSALNAAKVAIIGNIVTLTGGFTATVTNYDSAYQWSVISSVGTATINTQGGITVSGVTPSTAVELTVNATRATYAPGSAQVTVTTLALLRVTYNGTRATGGSVPTDATSYASNASATLLANPASGGLTLDGYYFSGWSLNADESGQIYQPNSTLQLGLVNVTLYAKWTLTQYTVTYYSNNATGGAVPIDSNTYTMGGSVPISANTGNLTRTGYSFIGWGISSTDTANPYVSGNTFTVGTNNIALWARWSANTYRVTYDANGGTGAPSKAYDDYTTAGAAISLATRGNLAKSGYDFNGWGLTASSTPVADQFTTAANIDLYAQWSVASFAVTYQLGTYGSGTLPTQASVNYGTSFTAAAATGLTGNDGTNSYAFVSWSDGTRTYAPGQSILMGAGVITLTAQWTRIYNVTYSFNGGSVATPIADQQKIAGDIIVISSVIPERAGYIFASWKDQSGETAVAGANYEVRANNYLLYAQWTARSYTITYDVNGGDTSPTQANRTIGQIFTVAAAPAKVGHDFEHWSDGTNNYNPGSDYQVGISNVTLQAIWTPKIYQISYNFNGGSGTPISTQNYTYGTGPAVLPASGPTRFEFNFLGWATTPTATTPVSASFTPSGSILMHAVWVTSVYRLTFNAGLGISDTATASVTIGQPITLPSGSRANYTLQGWSTLETGGTLLPLATPYTPTADAALFAQWAAQIFTVTYNGNRGTAGRASDSVTYNTQTQIVLPSATRANYVFKGWYSQATGGYLLGEAGANYLPISSITAYAQWVQGSLSGMGPATLIAQLTVRDGIDSGFNAGSNGSTATVTYPAGALPDGTVITAYLEESVTRVTSLLQTPATPILSLIIAWVAPDGTVPDTDPAKPIVMTVTNSSITAGSKVYGLVGNQPELMGVALVDGQVQVSITKDPAVVVAMVSPDAPTAVTATAIDSTSATISWTAPASNGGAAITGYTARSNATQTCTATTATSCVITGLATGTAYTFTVVATNAIGTSASSSASASLTLSAPPPPPSIPSTPTPSVPSGSGSSGSGSAGSGSSSAPAVNPVPVVVTNPVITSLTFVRNATKDGGKLVWVGSNIDAVLFTGDVSTYPTQFNYGSFTITWTGELRNMVFGKTYTAKLDFRSASGGSASSTISYVVEDSAEEIAAKAAAVKKALDDAKAAADKAVAEAIAATKAAAEKAAADAKAAAELSATRAKEAAEAAAAAALKAAQEISDAKAKAAAELKAAQDKAAADALIAAELKAAQEKAAAELKAAAEKKALEDAAAAAALAAKKIVPEITLYSISSKLTLSAYDIAYLNKYISTLKSKANVTCIGYYYTKNTTLAKAKALATTQATAVCKMIKKAKPTVVTKIVLYPATQAPKAAQGAKWVAVSYRVDSFKAK